MDNIDASKTKIGGVDNNTSKASVSALTSREKEVIILCCDGLGSKEIASQLNISARTVEKHKSNIFEKLGLNNTIDLVKWAIKNSLISL